MHSHIAHLIEFILTWVLLEILVEHITGIELKGWRGVLYRAVPYVAGVVLGYCLL